jgi:6-phosphogluconolactonase (cycloisomerase 2 family)
MFIRPPTKLIPALLGGLLLSACGGGGGGTASYTVGGSISGLVNSGLVLQLNGGNNYTASSNGTFTFSTTLSNGASYAVTISSQPANQTCSLSGAAGSVMSANVTVTISCTPPTYSIGGSVSGLNGTGLVLQDNGGDDLTVSADGSFTFPTPIEAGATYAVSVMTQPSGPAQYCIVSGGAGTVGAAKVTSVAIVCRNTGQYIYVTTTFGGTKGVITLFTIDPTNGALDREERYATSPPAPLGIALDTSGQYAYVAYENAASLGTETIATGGQFSETSDVYNGSGTLTYAVAVDPTAPYLFAGGTTDGVGTLFGYAISSGVLTALPSAPYSINGNAYGLVADPTGKFLYVPISTGQVWAFTISAADGSLTQLNGAPFTYQAGAPSNTPYAVAVYPAGGYLFFTDNTANTVSVYSYSAGSGAMTLVGSPYPVGTAPESVAVDPAGRFLYVANSGDGTVSAFTINAASGALKEIAGSPFPTGGGASTTPTAVAVEPSGQYLYSADGDAATITTFGINPSSGALSMLGSQTTVGGFGGTGASGIAIE